MATRGIGSAPTTIRPAIADDLDQIAAIFAHYVTGSVITFEQTPPTADHWRDVHAGLIDRGLPFLVATIDAQVAGYAYVAPWRTKPAYRHTVEDSIYLDPERTGRGIGRRLLDAVLVGAHAAGVEQVIAVIADTGHPASIALHRACDFLDAGRLRRVGHKHGQVLDTLLLQRDLTRGRPSGLARSTVRHD